MNVLLYAGDNKYYKTLLPIAIELRNRGINFIFMFTEETQLKFPHEKDFFYFDGDYDENSTGVTSETLGVQLPFNPDVLIIARERWQPEQSIIHEFKEKFKAKICCVEVSSHLINNIENRLEMLSRTQYPQNLVDYFFEHSSFAKERRIDCMDESYRSKCIVVGNPRFSEINRVCKDISSKYFFDNTKEKILFWGVINTTRDTAMTALSTLREKTKDTHQIFYKPYPGEPYNPKFANQFNPFIIDGVQIISDEDDIFEFSQICDTHIGQTSSVFNFAFMFDKKIVNLDSVCDGYSRMNDMKVYLNETGNGVEDSARFWMRIWGLNTFEQFESLIETERINQFNKTNKILIDSVREHTINFDWECSFLNKDKKNYSPIITYFDEFGFDEKSSNRIVNFLETIQD
jgi:hypothetical protein